MNIRRGPHAFAFAVLLGLASGGAASAEPHALGLMGDGVATGPSVFLHPVAEICTTNIGGEPVCHEVPDPPQQPGQGAGAPLQIPQFQGPQFQTPNPQWPGQAPDNRLQIPYLPRFVVVPHNAPIAVGGAALPSFWLQENVQIDVRSTQTGASYAWSFTSSGTAGVGAMGAGTVQRAVQIHSIEARWCQYLGCLTQVMQGLSGTSNNAGNLQCCQGGVPPQWSTANDTLVGLVGRILQPHAVSGRGYLPGAGVFTVTYPLPFENHGLTVRGTTLGTATNVPRSNLVVGLDISATWGDITGSGALIIDAETGQTLIERYDARGTFSAAGEVWSFSLFAWTNAQY